MATKKTAAADNDGSEARSKGTSWSDDAGRDSKSGAHLTAMVEAAARPVAGPVKQIILPPLDIQTIRVRVVGDSPLITHRWSQKARSLMLAKQMGEASAGKEHKDPAVDYQESLYVIDRAPDGHPFEDSVFGFPAIAFKNAAVTACTSLGKSVTKVAARQAFHMCGNLVIIEGKPRSREDMVRVGQGTADIRFRGEFVDWSCVLEIRYNARLLSASEVVNLMNTAGFAVGVGEWRPERDGQNGLFHVETSAGRAA